MVIYHIKANILSEGGNMIYNQNKVEMLRQRYPEGTRVCVDSMDDYCPIESGTFGTVEFVDDAGTLHCKHTVIDKTHTAKSLGKQNSLLCVWVYSELDRFIRCDSPRLP